jgi:glutamyl-Q tRNA(Asp) synthetase
LVAALASWLDARAHGGTWLLRIEDVDEPRCQPAHAEIISAQLQALGLRPDGDVWWQSRRTGAYQAALARLAQQGDAYGCRCTRASLAAWFEAQGISHERHHDRVYPGLCRPGLQPALPPHEVRAWRGRVPGPAGADDATRRANEVHWTDRRLGAQSQDLSREVGDFILLRADGFFAYQLAVVVDDGAQGITDIVRGEDLADYTPRQIWLQRRLGLPQPRYFHAPLVLNAHGEKLSKQQGAKALDIQQPLEALGLAAQRLGLGSWHAQTLAEWQEEAVRRWQDRQSIRS